MVREIEDQLRRYGEAVERALLEGGDGTAAIPVAHRGSSRRVTLAVKAALVVVVGVVTTAAVTWAVVADRDRDPAVSGERTLDPADPGPVADDGPIDWGPSHFNVEEWAQWRWWREQAPKEVARLEADPVGFEVPQPRWIPPGHELMRAVPSEVTAIEVATRDVTIDELTMEPATRDRIVAKDIAMDWAAVDEQARSLDHWIRIKFMKDPCHRSLFVKHEDAADRRNWDDGRIERVRFDNGEWVLGRASTSPHPDDPEGGILADAGSWKLRTCLGGDIQIQVSADPSVTLDTLGRMLGSIPGRASVGDYEANLR